nr:GYF domain-containing protein [uncultured Flavobacterium sp.]
MKKYYLHNGIESSGPFDIAELQIKQITASTPVWFSGMPDWKTAGEIEELQAILKVTPPPFQAVPPTTAPTPKKKIKNSKIMGLRKNTFYIASLFLVLIIGSVLLTILQENRRIDFEHKNDKTEKENRQFQLQEKEIQEQKLRLAEQEKLEAERLVKERKETINTRLSEIRIKQIENQTLLEDAKNRLTKANEFQFFRTADEKNKEINLVQTNINQLKNNIDSLENERNQLSLELDRIRIKARQNP